MSVTLVIHETVVSLETTFDTNSKFSEHIENLCHQANFKLHVLRRVKPRLHYILMVYIIIYILIDTFSI